MKIFFDFLRFSISSDSVPPSSLKGADWNEIYAIDLWFTPNEDGKVHLESRTFDGAVDFDITKGTLVREQWLQSSCIWVQDGCIECAGVSESAIEGV